MLLRPVEDLMWVAHWQYHRRGNMSKQTKGHKLHQIARWIKSTCLKLRLDSHSPHAPCTFNYFGASHGETNEWIEADITWHNMPTNILHSTNSAVSASLTHMHSSENVNYRESFSTQPNTLAGLNRSPCMLDLCTGFAILMLSKRKGSSSSRNVWYLPGSSELHFVWPNPSWSKVRVKGPFTRGANKIWVWTVQHSFERCVVWGPSDHAGESLRKEPLSVSPRRGTIYKFNETSAKMELTIPTTESGCALKSRNK